CMISPLSRLERFADRIAKGDLSARLDYESKDEIGTLVAHMNGMAAELEDIRKTMEKRIEDQSEQLASVKKLAAVGHIAAGVAHEINNPLATMQICVDSLSRKYSEPEHRGEHVLLQGYLRIIDDELKRCAAITSGLLDFSRERPPKKEPVDVKSLTEDTGRMLLLQKKYSNLCKVDCDFKADNNMVLGDDGQLRQVFLNLMGNGFDAMGGKGVVKVSTEAVSRFGRDMLCVKFEDSGHGIKSGDMGKMFMPFFTTKGAERGTGLGLSICKKIIIGHEGAIEAESVYGAGSTFTIYLSQYKKKDEAVEEYVHKGFFINLM
ncbi:MAG: ATP-binding protein, partial [Thermodesulfobacteriota bacterium]